MFPHSHPNSDLIMSGIIYIEVPQNAASADSVSGNLFSKDHRTKFVC